LNTKRWIENGEGYQMATATAKLPECAKATGKRGEARTGERTERTGKTGFDSDF
tara:strand:+ start:538 stop:699 length:162 start_codon:yes stop_codon:yes gene_type:complete